jgi:hypothetical protein
MLAPPNRGGLNSTHIHGTSVPVEEPSTASGLDSCTAAKNLRQLKVGRFQTNAGWDRHLGAYFLLTFINVLRLARALLAVSRAPLYSQACHPISLARNSFRTREVSYFRVE